jgi:uncharacterized integral membrane protein (TIGR00698 family)
VFVPGLLIAAAVSCIAFAMNHRFPTVSPHVLSVGFGIVGATFGRIEPSWRPGLRWSAKRVLRGGIVLLGFRLSLRELGHLGPRVLIAVVAVVALTFFGTRWLARLMGLPAGLGLLLATGYSICGASAIAAMEPFSDASEEEVAYSIALVTLCGTLAIVVLPLLGRLFGLGDSMYGAWVGASVHDVGQVVAAGSSRSLLALKYAVIVKLTRVALLAPLLALVALRSRGTRSERSAGSAPWLPLFIVLFLVAVAIRSTGVLSTASLGHLKDAETLLLGMGLFGLGCNVDVRRLRKVGGRPLALGLLAWALVAVVSLVAVAAAGV